MSTNETSQENHSDHIVDHLSRSDALAYQMDAVLRDERLLSLVHELAKMPHAEALCFAASFLRNHRPEWIDAALSAVAGLDMYWRNELAVLLGVAPILIEDPEPEEQPAVESDGDRVTVPEGTKRRKKIR